MNYERWKRMAEERVNMHLDVGDTFELKDLFTQHEWDELTRGEKVTFGRLFANDVKEMLFDEIAFRGKRKNNHNEYIKIRE